VASTTGTTWKGLALKSSAPLPPSKSQIELICLTGAWGPARRPAGTSAKNLTWRPSARLRRLFPFRCRAGAHGRREPVRRRRGWARGQGARARPRRSRVPQGPVSVRAPLYQAQVSHPSPVGPWFPLLPANGLLVLPRAPVPKPESGRFRGRDGKCIRSLFCNEADRRARSPRGRQGPEKEVAGKGVNGVQRAVDFTEAVRNFAEVLNSSGLKFTITSMRFNLKARPNLSSGGRRGAWSPKSRKFSS